MVMKFSDYTKGFRNSLGPTTNQKLVPPKSANPEAKRRYSLDRSPASSRSF